MDVLCSDKTGTLTLNKLTLDDVRYHNLSQYHMAVRSVSTVPAHMSGPAP